MSNCVRKLDRDRQTIVMGAPGRCKLTTELAGRSAAWASLDAAKAAPNGLSRRPDSPAQLTEQRVDVRSGRFAAKAGNKLVAHQAVRVE